MHSSSLIDELTFAIRHTTWFSLVIEYYVLVCEVLCVLSLAIALYVTRHMRRRILRVLMCGVTSGLVITAHVTVFRGLGSLMLVICHGWMLTLVGICIIRATSLTDDDETNGEIRRNRFRLINFHV